MRRMIVLLLVMAAALPSVALPPRVALLEFADETGMKADALLGGKVNTEVFASKGIYTLARQLTENDNFTVIDRRDFIKQMERLSPADALLNTPHPTFIHAAQLLRADAVLRAGLISLSTGKKRYNQAGQKAEFTVLSLRVVLQALDAVDGSVLSVAEGAAKQEFRQTDVEQTELGEDELLDMLKEAITAAVVDLKLGLEKNLKARAERARVNVSIETTDDPALVEIDGVLVGSSPIQGLAVYKGDHVLTISRPGYETITKRLVLDSDVKVSAPMLRTDLTADERKEIMMKAEIRAYITDDKLNMIIHEVD